MNEDKQSINVTVAGGYTPSVIKLKKASLLKSISSEPTPRDVWTSYILMQ